MKAILGWLGDPYLHLIGIGVVVLAVGARMGSAGSARADTQSGERCEVCRKLHESYKPCYEVVTSAAAVSVAR